MPATIIGTVFHDSDHDGRLTPGEPGIPDVTLVLYPDPASVPGPGCTSVVTGPDGTYTFAIDIPGTYTIYETVSDNVNCPPDSVTQPAGYSFSNGPRKQTVTVTAEEINSDLVIPGPDFSHDTLYDPLVCDSTMIQFAGQPSQWRHINLVTGSSELDGPLSRPDSINAIGYNTTDNYLYGYDQTEQAIVRITQNREVVILSPLPTGLPAVDYTVGSFDTSGFYYLYSRGTSRCYTIDLRPDSPTFLKLVDPSMGYEEQTSNYGTPLSAPLQIGDWAYYANDGGLYGVEPNGVVYRVDIANGLVFPLDTTGPNPGSVFGSVVIDGSGHLYAVTNSDGTIYRYTISGNTADGVRFSATLPDPFHDAAMCPTAVIEVDFGDAPDAGGGGSAGSYNTLLASNGPRHGLTNSLYLGYQVTAEEDAYQNANADGDDQIQNIQDDGLAVPLPVLPVGAASYSLDVTVTNQTGETAYLYGWVDFNKNGLFEADEAAPEIPIPPSGTGQYPLTFTVPPGTILTPGHTFARLRLTTELLTDTGQEAQDTRSVGPAPDGEVEDYILEIGTTADLLVTKTADVPELRTGDAITYTVTVTNASFEDAYNVVLEDIVPPEITNVTYSRDGGPASYWPGTLALDTLTPGQLVVITITGVFDGSVPGPVVNTATATTTSFDPNPDNNTARVITPVVIAADLRLEKTGPASIAAGEQITYSILVANDGPDEAVEITVGDTLPAAIEDAEVSIDGAPYVPWTGSYTIPSLEPLASQSFLIRGTVSASASGQLINTASATSSTPDPDPDNNTSTVTTDITASADISVVKTASPEPAVPGQYLTYTVAVSNAGPSASSDVTLSDPVPADLTGVMVSTDETSWSAWSSPYTVGTLTPGQTVSLYLRGTVASSASDSITNTATVTSATPDPDPDNNTYDVTTPVYLTADISVEKTAAPNPVQNDDPLTYTIVVTNDGPADSQSVTLNDTLPGALTGGEYSTDGGTTWNPWPGYLTLGTVAAEAAVTVLIRGTVAGTAMGTIINTAFVSSQTPDPDPGNNSSTVLTPIGTSADLSVSKSGSPSPAVPGQLLTYTVTVVNDGPDAALEARLADDLPAVLTNAEFSVDGGTTWNPWVSPYTIGDMTAGQTVTLELRGLLSAAASGLVENTVSVSSATPDPDPSNNSYTALTPVGTAADLSIAKSAAPDPAVPGELLTYTLTVHNAGPNDAAAITVTDPIPAALDNPEYSLNGSSYTPWTGNLGLTSLASGDTALITIRGTLNQTAISLISNTATVSSATPDPNPANNTDTTQTQISPSSDLTMTKTGSPDPAVPGELLTYTLTVYNAGPSTARDITIIDAVPNVLTGVQYTVGTGTVWNDWTGIHQLTTLAADTSYTITLRGTLSPSATGRIVNTAIVAASTPDPDPDNNIATDNREVAGSADLSVIKTVSPTPLVPGQPVTYTLTASNAGPSAAQNVILTDALPAVLENQEYSVDGGQTWSLWTGSYTIPSLAEGQTLALRLRGLLPLAAQGAGHLLNTASITSDTADPNPDNNTFTIITPISGLADLAVQKTVDKDYVNTGDVVTYTVTIRHLGNVAADNVVLRDILPEGLTNPEVSTDGGLTWQTWYTPYPLGTIQNLATRTILIRGTVTAVSGSLTNTAYIGSDTPDPDYTNNSSHVTIEVGGGGEHADLSITKTSEPATAYPGQSVTYTIAVTNHGPAAAKRVLVYDTVSQDLSDVEYSADNGASWLPWTNPWQAGTLAAGSTALLLIRGRLTDQAAGSTINTAVVASTTEDPNPSDNTATVIVPVEPGADVSIQKLACPACVYPYQPVTYQLRVTNHGPGTARGVTITDDLPPAITNAFYTCNNGRTWNPWYGSLVIGDLSACSSVTINIRGIVDSRACGSVTNEACISSLSFDPRPENNRAFATICVRRY